MTSSLCSHGKRHPFCLELSVKRPENTCQIIGFFPDGTVTTCEPCPWLESVKTTFGSFKEGLSFVVQPNVLAVCVKRPETRIQWQELGAKLLNHAPAHQEAAIMVDGLDQDNMLNVAYGCELGSWRFERYRTEHRPIDPHCAKAYIVHPMADQKAVTMQRMMDHHLIDSVHWGRDMANQPGNMIYPETFAQQVLEFKHIGINVEVMDQEHLKDWGALIGVAKGSEHPARVVVASWQGAPDSSETVALVGKGVTFDSGGLSLKPANSMEEMKFDKMGAVSCAAVVRALALQKAPVNVVAVLALVENMPSGSAQRPGDIVTSLSGQTIEVLNTDAEGRLILADALTYTQRQFNPAIIVDVATLTGAIIVALGSAYAGLFTHQDDLADQLIRSGEYTGEKLWRMPIAAEYDKAMNSDCADMKNISGSGVGAGSGTAAAFLGRFVHPNQMWVHLDIAGVDMAKTSTPLTPKGGVAFGVQLLEHFIKNSFNTGFVKKAMEHKQRTSNEKPLADGDVLC